nr:SRb [Planomonas micra]
MYLYLVLALVLVAAAAAFLLSRGGSSKRSMTVLVGPVGGGKTALFHRLVHGGWAETYTSMKENEAAAVVDVPGHPRLLPVLADFLPVAKGIVFVIDAAAYKTRLNDTTELLYNVMTDETLIESGVPLLILLNKTDLLPDAADVVVQAVQTRLAEELTKLCATKAAAPEKTNVEDRPNRVVASLVADGESFAFETAPLVTSFGTASVKKDELDDVRAFIEA